MRRSPESTRSAFVPANHGDGGGEAAATEVTAACRAVGGGSDGGGRDGRGCKGGRGRWLGGGGNDRRWRDYGAMAEAATAAAATEAATEAARGEGEVGSAGLAARVVAGRGGW